MAKVVADMSMSLDGFIADPDDGVEHLFGWYDNGDIEVTTTRPDLTFHTSKASAEHLRESFADVGALICGRRLFDITNGWGGNHPVGAPVFVVTHTVPEGWPREDAPFTFVTDGPESAVRQAQAVAGAGRRRRQGRRGRDADDHPAAARRRAARRDRGEPGARPARRGHPVLRQSGRARRSSSKGLPSSRAPTSPTCTTACASETAPDLAAAQGGGQVGRLPDDRSERGQPGQPDQASHQRRRPPDELTGAPQPG